MNVNFLLGGAKFIKNNQSQFKADCAKLATDASVCTIAASQLKAASIAGIGKTNTGLSETGWRGLAELIGMISPSSTKLIDHSTENKNRVLAYWLKTGYYPSTRADGKGGSKGAVIGNPDAWVLLGVTPMGKTELGRTLNAAVNLATEKQVSLAMNQKLGLVAPRSISKSANNKAVGE